MSDKGDSKYGLNIFIFIYRVEIGFKSSFKSHVKYIDEDPSWHSYFLFLAWINNHYFGHNIFFQCRIDTILVGDKSGFMFISPIEIGFESIIFYVSNMLLNR